MEMTLPKKRQNKAPGTPALPPNGAGLFIVIEPHSISFGESHQGSTTHPLNCDVCDTIDMAGDQSRRRHQGAATSLHSNIERDSLSYVIDVGCAPPSWLGYPAELCGNMLNAVQQAFMHCPRGLWGLNGRNEL